MKSFKKTIIVTLSILLLILPLTSCGGDDDYPDVEPIPEPEYTETATIVADFSSGSEIPRQKELYWGYNGDLDLTILSNYLSSITGLDFFIDGIISDDVAFITWMDNSTLVAGLDDREQNEDYFFFDAVSLNWFMMDSLASTIKANFPEIAEIYYSGEDGGPILFPNPEDMASQGLPVLPIDMPYEGSAFFYAHAGGRGTLWDGFFISEDGNKFLLFEDCDGQSFQFAFTSNEGDSSGTGQISADNSELAEGENFVFWFLDNDSLIVAGGIFEATYIRNEGDL